MATPRELVTTVAAALGAPEPTVIQLDRRLADAGLRSKLGRGPSAAKVTPRDAANLIIAAAISPPLADAVEVVRTYASLPLAEDIGKAALEGGRKPLSETKIWRLRDFSLPKVSDLPADHTFGDLLASVISSVAEGEYAQAKRRAEEHVDEDELKVEAGRMLFRFIAPRPIINVEISNPFSGAEHHTYSQLSFGADMYEHRKVEAAWKARYGNGDLIRTFQITHRTILDVGGLLSLHGTGSWEGLT